MRIYMTIKLRYDELISHFSAGNKRLFCKRIGVAPTVLENIVGKRQTKPSFDVLEKTLCAFENISARWLITGEGEMTIKEIQENKNNINELHMIRELAGENALLKNEVTLLKKKLNQTRGYDIAAER